MKLRKFKLIIITIMLFLNIVLLLIACNDDIPPIEEFSVTGQISESDINYSTKTIILFIGEDIDKTNLEPNISIPEGYSILPDEPQDFSSPVTYTVISDETKEKEEWTVIVEETELVLDLSNFEEGNMGHSNNNISVSITTDNIYDSSESFQGLKVDYDIPDKNNTNVNHRWSSPFDLSEATHLKFWVYGNECGNRLAVQFMHEENGSLEPSDMITVEDSIDFTGWREIIVDLETIFEDVDFEQIRRFLLIVQNNSGVNSYVIYDDIKFYRVDY